MKKIIIKTRKYTNESCDDKANMVFMITFSGRAVGRWLEILMTGFVGRRT